MAQYIFAAHSLSSLNKAQGPLMFLPILFIPPQAFIIVCSRVLKRVTDYYSTIAEIGAKSIRKRHVRRDWLIIPDTIAFCIYGSVNDLYLPAGKLLMDIFETPVVQNTRSFIIDVTSQLTLKGEELQSKIADFWKEISASQN
ncbi:hypothetical protein XELAEV_18011336mg [Xenopus laevis]|uniref:Apovitellenin-1 n=1 Tax=Xenopus laevis TaxID=8355 RepID=A0A974HXM9_XENLA|nr:hypothetical protein XELAEV_18011336mg [Xenopus laevis]